jgi:site-specific DNA-methyltransferase (adenine-specific)
MKMVVPNHNGILLLKNLLKMENQVLNIDPTILVKNELKLEIYTSKPSNYDEMKSNIDMIGIIEPIIVESKTNKIISGNLRLEIALELGLKLVPVIYQSEADDLKVISTNQQRRKTLVDIYKEIEFFKKQFKVKKGQRTDLDPELAKLKQDRDDFLDKIPKDTRVKLASLDKMMSVLHPDNSEEKLITILSNIDSGKGSVNSSWKSTREKYKQHLNEQIIPGEFEVHRQDVDIYNSSSSNMEQVGSKSIQTIITSPPYFKMKKYFVGKDERGQEKTVDLFIENLMLHFKECHRVLKDDGSIFVNINDNNDNGKYNLVNHKFVLAMCANGFKLNDEFIWIKNNANPTRGKRSVRNHEYIYHFVKDDCKSFYYSEDWLLEEQDEYGVFKFGKNSLEPKLLSGFDCRLGVLKTNGANNAELIKLCAKYGIEMTHHATFPEILPYIFLKSTTKPGQTVLDPFNGSGTTGKVAKDLGLKYVGFDLSSQFIKISELRIFKNESNNEELVRAA